MIDVTIRAPHATTYGATCAVPGLAAKEGEKCKRVRYGADVSPSSFETFGRLGVLSCTTLDILAFDVELWSFGRHVAAHMAADWQAELETTLAYEMADCALISMGEVPGLFAGC